MKNKFLHWLRMTVIMALVVLCASGLTQCTSSTNEMSQAPLTPTPSPTAFKVGIALSIGGLGDKSYNDSAFDGVRKAHEKLGIQFDYVEPATSIDTETRFGANHLRQYAKNNYDVVIATGYLIKDGCEEVAKEFPQVRFVLIDAVVDLPNVTCLTFNTAEGSFLVGAVAGIVTKSNVIGYIGAQDNALFKEFQHGYIQGAAYTNPKLTVKSLMIDGDNPFAVPNRGHALALELIGQKADVVYTVAGSSGIGAIEACKEKGVFAIGVDSDQDYLAKGTVITSMMKKVDVAVYTAIEQAVNGTLKPGVMEFGIKNRGVDTSPFTYTQSLLPPGTVDRIEQIRQDIIQGKIQIQSN